MVFYFLLIKKSCCIFLRDKINGCLDGNNPNASSINFNKSINEFNITNNYINSQTKININKNPTYNIDDISNNEELNYNYKKIESNIQEDNNENNDKNMELETPISNNNIIKEDINELNRNKINNNINEINQYGNKYTNNINYNNNENIFDYSNEKKDNSNFQINNISNNENENQQLKLEEENPALREKEKMIKNSSYEDNSNYFKEEVETSNVINQENNDKNNFLNEGNKNVHLDKQEKLEKEKENNNVKDKEIIKKEIYSTGEKIRSKIMDRINKGRARSCDNKNQKDTQSQNILMKAKLLEKVLGNMKEHVDSNNIYVNNNSKKEIIKYNNESSKSQVENIPLNKNKKKKKNIIPFKE